MVEQQYRWDFIGLSTDSKPTPETSPKVVDGSTFYTSDDSKFYVWCKNDWYEKKAIGGGGELSSYGTLKYKDGDNVEHIIDIVDEGDFLELGFDLHNSSYATLRINGISISLSKILEIEVADGVQYIPAWFGAYFSNLTKVTLPSTIHYIGDYFCMNANLTSPLNLDNVVSIGSNFLYGCANFNQPLSLPKIKFISGGFLYNCSSFNTTLTLNDGTRQIGGSFMRNCTAFAQSFTVPSSLEYDAPSYGFADYFMNNCKNFTGPLICNGPVSAGILPTSVNVLSTTDATAPMYTTGVTLTGPYKQLWRDKYADRDTSPYRKLIVGS